MMRWMVLSFLSRHIKVLAIALGVFLLAGGMRSSQAQSPIGEAQGKRRLEVQNAEDVPVGVSKTWLETLESIEVTTPLAPGFRVSISGTVRDPDGTPVEKALVVLREEPSLVAPYMQEMQDLMNETRNTNKTVMVRDVYAKTFTNADGQYEFKDISVGGLGERRSGRKMVWNIIAVASSNQIGWHHLQLPTPRTSDPSSVKPVVQSDQGDIVLREGTTVSGRLVDQQGQPVRNALVRVGTIDRPREESRLTSEAIDQRYSDAQRLGLYHSELQRCVRTDEQGQFQFLHMPQDSVLDVFFHHTDHRFDGAYVWTGPHEPTAKETYPLASGPHPISVSPLTIEEVEAIRTVVRVVNEDGLPIAGARVWSNPENKTTDENGEVVFVDTALTLKRRAGMNRNNPQLFMQSTPPENSVYVSTRLTIPLEELLETRKVEIVLPRGRQVTGTVLDASDGSPITDATVAFFGHKSNEPRIRWLGNYARVKTDHLGQYKATLSGDDLNGEFPVYAIVTDSKTHETFKAPSTMSSPEDWIRHGTEVATDSKANFFEVPPIQLRRQASLQVRVTDANDHPIAQAVVELRGVALYERKTGPRTYRSFREVEVSEKRSSNEDGIVNFQLASTEFDTLTIAADDVSNDVKRFARAEFTRDEIVQVITQVSPEAIQVVVGPGVTITGSVTVDEKPRSGVEVQLSRHVGPSGMLRTTGGFTSRPIMTATTNEQGQYEFNAAPENRFSVTIRKSPVDGRHTAYGYSPTKVGPRSYEVRPFEFESPEAIAAVSTSIVGLVTNQDGQPLPKVRLQFRNYKSDGGRRSSMQRIESATSDRMGKFKMNGVRNEPMTVWAIPDRTTYPDLTSQFVDIDPSKPAHIQFDTRLVGETRKLSPVRVISRQEWKGNP